MADSLDVANITLTTNQTMVNMTTQNPDCLLNDMCESYEDYMVRLQDEIVPLPGEWVLIVLYIVTFLVGFIGNLLVCWAIWRNRTMRTITNMFIVNLSLADLVVIVLVLPFALCVDVTNTWFFGTAFCKIHIFLGTTSLSISILTLSAIAVERWYAICHPLRFHSTISRTRLIIIGIWVISICVGVPELTLATVVPLSPHYNTVLFSSCYPALWSENYIIAWQICLMVGLYFLPLFLMGFAYSNIAIVLWKDSVPGAITRRSTRKPMLKKTPSADKRKCSDSDDQVDNRKSAAKMLIAVVVVFGLCYFPSHLYNILRYAGQITDIPHPYVFALIAHWLTFLNSCINPIIYNFMSDKFRKEFRAALCFQCGRNSGTDGPNERYKMTFSGKTYSARYSTNYNGSTVSSNTFVENIHLNSTPPKLV